MEKNRKKWKSIEKMGKNGKNALCVKNIGYGLVLMYVTIEWIERIYSTLNFTW